MKLTRYILAALTLWATALPSAAQTDVDATITAVRKVIENHERNALPFVESEILSKYKKNAEVLTAIAGACDDFDSTLTFSYIDKVFAVNANYVPAYIVKGKSYRRRGDYEQALLWFDKAIAANPNDSTGYLAYADVLVRQGDLDGAAQKMASLLQYNPTSNIYAEIGVMYLEYGATEKVNEGIDSFDKADVLQMTHKQIQAYVRLLRAAGTSGAGIGAYNRIDSILNLAFQKYPSNASLNRLMLDNSLKLKKYSQAINVADVLFNKSDSLEIELNDYLNYGKAYVGLNRYKEAICVYQMCVDHEIKREDYRSDKSYETAKKTENQYKSSAMQQIAFAYNKMGYADEAINAYIKYIEDCKIKGTLAASDYSNLAALYGQKAAEMNGEEKKEVLHRQYETYGLAAELSPEDAPEAYYYRLRMVSEKLIDPDGTEGLLIQNADKLIELIPISDDMSGTNYNYLLNALKSSISYYVERDAYLKIRKYWEILGQLNPDDNFYIVLDKNYRRKMGIR